MTTFIPARLRVAQISMHTDPLDALGGNVTGGMNVYVHEMAKALSIRGVWVDVFTRVADANAPRIVKIARSARLIRIPAGPPEPLDKNDLSTLADEFAAGIMAFAEQENEYYNILSAHYWLSGLAGEKIARHWEVPFSLRYHTLAALKNRVLPVAQKEPGPRLAAETRLARQSSALLVSSLDEAELLTHEYAADPARIHFIPCGVDSGRFAPLPRDKARAQLGLGAETPIILSVGRVDPIKGLDQLVDALRLIKEKRPGLPFRAIHLGGTLRTGAFESPLHCHQPEDFAAGNQREEVSRILAQVAGAGLSEHFCFIGACPQDALPAYYSAADVLAIPSRHETFGIVSLEAAACELPAVAFRVGGLPGSIENEKSGLLVKEGDIEGYAEALLSLIENTESRRRLGRLARERALQFRWSDIAEKEISVWKKMLAENQISDTNPMLTIRAGNL